MQLHDLIVTYHWNKGIPEFLKFKFTVTFLRTATVSCSLLYFLKSSIGPFGL